jgi:hypothetical protein
VAQVLHAGLDVALRALVDARDADLRIGRRARQKLHDAHRPHMAAGGLLEARFLKPLGGDHQIVEAVLVAVFLEDIDEEQVLRLVLLAIGVFDDLGAVVVFPHYLVEGTGIR